MHICEGLGRSFTPALLIDALSRSRASALIWLLAFRITGEFVRYSHYRSPIEPYTGIRFVPLFEMRYMRRSIKQGEWDETDTSVVDACALPDGRHRT